MIEVTPLNKVYLLTESLESTHVIVRQTELNADQANLNANSNTGVTGFVVNGKIKLCSPGCNDCTSGACTGCLTGFTFDSTSATCFICGPNCLACDSANPLTCSSCVAGAFLSGTICAPCNSSCISCTITANQCNECPPSQYFDGGQCAFCGKNCQNCSDANTCTLCNKGFVKVTFNATIICRSCIISCSSCNPANITECTSCGKGLQLLNGACIQCPNKCAQCNNGNCAVCVPGYSPNANGVCVLNCKLPCATCYDNQPSACLSCYSGSNLVGFGCQIDLSCNNGSTCTDCGQGLGYILVAGQCLGCSQLSNCVQCSQTNSELCAICSTGFFVNSSSLCGVCPSRCSSCVSEIACTSCAIGYTLAEGQSQGQCLACQSPCASCIGSQTYCTSCVGGYTKKGWKCQNNQYVGFTISFSTNGSDVFNQLDTIIRDLLVYLHEDPTNFHAITFETLKDGSFTGSG